MAWLVDEDEDPDIIILSSSPIASTSRTATFDDNSVEFVGFSGTTLCGTVQPQQDPDDSIEFVETQILKPLTGAPRKTQQHTKAAPPDHVSDFDESIEFIMANSAPARIMVGSSEKQPATSPIPKSRREINKNSMPPPMLPQYISAQSYLVDYNMPEPSFPVRPAVMQKKARLLVAELLESPVLEMPAPSQRRLHRRTRSPSANCKINKTRTERPTKHPKDLRSNPILDTAAVHSGDETSEGSSHAEDDVESESDRLFLEEMPETQVSPSYDQTLAYRQSLFTQAPLSAKAPTFANPPMRHYKSFGNGVNENSRPRNLPSSSPPRYDTELDEYAFGSFVVDDEADISYLSDEPSGYVE
jgi:ATP-dependent DNA helicase MPH1